MVQIVNTGIDTIKVNVKRLGKEGKQSSDQAVSDSLLALLQAWQDKARMQKKPLATTMTFHDARMVMLPNGSPTWRYLIKNDCIQVAVAPRLKIPILAKVTFSSSYLWEVGCVSDAVDEVHAFLLDIFGNVMLQASQIDLCVDVVGFTPPNDWLQVFISRARGKREIEPSQKDEVYYKGHRVETINFSGHGRPISCKIYNKTMEIKQRSPGKIWFHDIWKRHGWDEESDVWRDEFSIEREALHEMDLEDIYDVLRNVKRLWQYCTYEWLRMATPCHDVNRSRWLTDPSWECVQRAFDAYGSKTGDDGLGPLVRERKRAVNVEQGVAAIAGYATTLAAWCDHILDEHDGADEIFSLVYDQVIERWKKQGVVPQDLVREKRFIYARLG